MKTKGRFRRIVVRGRRRYSVCGLSARPTWNDEPKPLVAMWLPGATFVLVLIFSAYIIGRPPAYPLVADRFVAHGAVARFTIDDFANAAR